MDSYAPVNQSSDYSSNNNGLSSMMGMHQPVMTSNNTSPSRQTNQLHSTLESHHKKFTLLDMLTRILKYIFEGCVVALAALLVPQKTLHMKEVLTIGITAAAIFALLDLWAPTVGSATRSGAGFGIGAGLVGFPGVGAGGIPGAM